MIDRLRNHALIGMIIGLCSPAILGMLAVYLMENVIAFRQADLLLIGCVALNLWWMNLMFKNHKDHIAKGVIAATIFYAFVFFVYKVMQEI